MKGTRGYSGFLAAAFAAAFCAVGSPAAVAQEGDREFADTTLAGIYELALENDLTIAQARAQYRVGAEERKLARAGILPSVQAGYDYSESESERRGRFSIGDNTVGNNTDLDADTHAWDVSLVQPLFDMQAWFTFRQGAELSKQAEANFTVAQQQLLFRSIRAYFEVLRAATNLKASRAQESALKAQLDQVKQRFDVGMVAITDVHEAQAGFDLAVAQRIADDGNLGIARELLSVLTGRPHGDLWVLEKEFPVVNPVPAAGDEWVQFAHTNNHDIKAAQHARDAAQRGARAAASAHLPTLDLQLSYQDANSDVTQTDIVTDSTVDFPNDEARGVVALSLTVPVFTGGFTSANRRQASARYDTQIATFEGTVRTITQETRASHILVTSDVARSKARAQAVTSTRSALEAAEVGYDVGTRNVVDVLNAQQAFFSAVRDYENSIIDYVIDLAQLKRLAGTLSPEDIYDLNQWLEAPPDPSASGADSEAATLLNRGTTP
jgi:outer membrane protein